MKSYSKDASKQYHTQVGIGDVGRYILMPGDPKRCTKIAKYLDNPRLIADNREFTTYTGTLDGVKVSVTSTGIGGPSTAIAIEELSRVGADTFVRVGTCGGMQKDVKSGDIVIATGAVRMDGTTLEYAPIEYPAVASPTVVGSLIEAARSMDELDTDYQDSAACSFIKSKASMCAVHVGVIQSKDSFFGQHEPEKMPVGYELTAKWTALKMLGCLASEMESSTLFIVGAKLHARTGSCLLVVANQEREKLGLDNPVINDIDLAVRTAVEAVRVLISRDRQDIETGISKT